MKKFFNVCLVLTLFAGAFLLISLTGRVNTLQAEKSVLQRKRDTAQTLYEQTKKELTEARADWQTQRDALAGEIDGLNEALSAARKELDAQAESSRRALADAQSQYDQAQSAWKAEMNALTEDRDAAAERLQAVTELLLPDQTPVPEEPPIPETDAPTKDYTNIFFP